VLPGLIQFVVFHAVGTVVPPIHG